MTQAGFGWKAKVLTLLVPSVIYFVMFMGQQFPATEREAAGVPFGDMFKELARPLFVLVWFCMILTAGTELGAGSWIPTIFNRVTQSATQAGILQVVWINMVMYLMRQFGHNVSHKIAPTALIAVSAIVAAVGPLHVQPRRRRSPRPSCGPASSRSASRSGGRRCSASRRSASRGPARWAWR